MIKRRQSLLVLLGGYYPSYGAPGIVFEKMIPVLRKHYEITILTQKRTKHDLGDVFTYNDVTVHEVSDWINDRVVSRTTNRLGRLMWRCVQNIWWLLQNQPLFTFNIRNTLKYAEELHNLENFDAVFSVSFPPYTHFVAALLKSRHPDLKWCAYSTDTLFGHGIFRRRWKKILMKGVLLREIKVYGLADSVFFTPEIYGWCNRMFPNQEVKPESLNYLLTLPAQNCQPSEKIGNQGVESPIHFVYAGVFYERTRDPHWFVQVMRRLLAKNKKFIFDFYLVTDVCKDVIEAVADEYPKNVILHPPVLPAEVLHVMRAASVLLNFSNDADQFSPSKIFDYVATGRPIVNVSYPGRVVDKVLVKNPLALTIINGSDIDRCSEEIEKFVSKNHMKSLNVDELSNLYSEYLPENALKPLISSL